jgi:hypothetical protein
MSPSLRRFAGIAAIGALALAASGSARADDAEPATRKVRIPVQHADAPAPTPAPEPAPAPAERKDPIASLLGALRSRMDSRPGGDGSRDPLDAWFAGGTDVPLAELRDALKKDGWDAASLRAWVAERAVATALRVARRAEEAAERRAKDREERGPFAEGTAYLLWREDGRWRMEPVDVGRPPR